MTNTLSKIISVFLLITFTTMVFPVAQFVAFAQTPEFYNLKDDNISVNVSLKNGGFTVDTVEGNKLIKSDNNKKLLYHNDGCDTSFASFQVTYPNNETKDYIFGGNYSFLGLSGNNLTTKQEASTIISTWVVDGLTFTQKVELSNQNSVDHGLVVLSYTVTNAGSTNVMVRQRLLLDSALGEQDYGYYKVLDVNNNLRNIQQEQVVEIGDYIPLNFFAYDNLSSPSITSYTANSTDSLPYQVAFGHWNHLSSTLFDFTPDPQINFTNKNNQYSTADSAYALYYDMGWIPQGGTSKNITSKYGVYSNSNFEENHTTSVNLTGPKALTLSDDKSYYLKTDPFLQGDATFNVQVQFQNESSTKNYSSVTIVAYPSNGITALSSSGATLNPSPTLENPFSVEYSNFEASKMVSNMLYFKADVGSSVTFRKIEVAIFDTSKPSVGKQSKFIDENLIGTATIYIMCPAGNGELPKITLTSRNPDTLYYSGTRHLYLTGKNLGLLNGDKSLYSLCAYNRENPSEKYVVASNNILFPSENVMDVTFVNEMVPGVYDLKFELTSEFANSIGSDKVITAPALSVTMSEEIKYSNDCYGIVAVVQKGSGEKAQYEIKSYKDENNKSAEANYNNDIKNHKEVLLTFRGLLEKHENDNTLKYTATSYKSTDINGKNIMNNTITLNNCMDFENGNIAVYYTYDKDGKPENVCVDFDGNLYTSVARTKICNGKSSLTKLKNGKEYSLLPYNKNGEKIEGFSDETISLALPGAAGYGQTLAGMVFNLMFGTLGVMYDTEETDSTEITSQTPEKGKLIMFGGALDLNFLVPKSKEDDSDNVATKSNESMIIYPKSKSYASYEEFKKAQSKVNNIVSNIGTTSLSVGVDNILFGCGRGFVGINFDIAVALPSMIKGMPELEGELKVNTIGDWSFGVSGTCDFPGLVGVDVILEIKSRDNIPIPDKFYIHVKSEKAAINIDTVGVIWIAGLGGGIDKLYDTIYCKDSVPPLTLLLTADLSLFKVISASTNLSLSAQAIGINAKDLTIADKVTLINNIGADLTFYPRVSLLGNLDMDVYGFIIGKGYLVINQTAFEGYAQVQLCVPKNIDYFGGIVIGGVGIGYNTQKIWGGCNIMKGINMSVEYYWGAGVKWTSGGDGVKPTFPDLLGCEDIPIYYDRNTDKTLYMTVGKNLKLVTKAEITNDFKAVPRLLSTAPSLFSQTNKQRHILNAGTYNGQDYLYALKFDADSIDDAKAKASQFTIKDLSGNDYGLNYYSQDLNNATTSNANLTYNTSTKKATLAISLTDSADFDKDWEIKTPQVSADIILLEAAQMPEMTSLNATLNGSNIDVKWDGKAVDTLDSVSFFLTKDTTSTDPGQLISEIKTKADMSSKSVSIAIPPQTSSGTYYLRAVYSLDGVVKNSIVNNAPITYTNANQPSEPANVVISNSGDLTYQVAFDNALADGYATSVYEVVNGQRQETDIKYMSFDKKDGVLPNIKIGGSYVGLDAKGQNKTIGLTAGKTYQVGMIAKKYIDSDADGNTDYTVLSNEVFSNELTLKQATTPNVSLNATTAFKTIPNKEWRRDSNNVKVETDISYNTFMQSDVDYSVSSDSNITGSWNIDNSDVKGDFTDTKNFSINLKDVGEGTHTLYVKGKDSDSDGFMTSTLFVVDTLPPKLLLSNPINGSCFGEDGSLNIEGITDQDAIINVSVDGKKQVNDFLLDDLGGSINSDGAFSFKLNVDPSVSNHTISLSVRDKAGNSYTKDVNVQNVGFSNIDSLSIYANGVQYTDNSIALNSTGTTVSNLSLVAKTKSSSFTINNSEFVKWNATAINGSVSVSDSGVFSATSGSYGYVTGGLRVSENVAMESGSTFGENVYDIPLSQLYSLTLGATVGGTVSGSGNYKKDAQLSITATPSAGYKFSRWISEDSAAITDVNSAQTTITMPDKNTTVTAEFVYAGFTSVSSRKSNSLTIITTKFSKSGEKVAMKLDEKMNPNNVTVCINLNGTEKVVALCEIKDGSAYFYAPYDGQYYLKEKNANFKDVDGHWAGNYIKMASARNLFNGLSDDMFGPNETMTRGMFVTVLGRLQGIDVEKYTKESKFKDVPKGEWYAPYVLWATENELAFGYDNGYFGINDNITREQMCSMLWRYLKFAGYSLTETNNEIKFADEEAISSWAKEAVKNVQKYGLIQGIGNNAFNPNGNAKRAEVCAVFIRLIEAIVK